MPTAFRESALSQAHFSSESIWNCVLGPVSLALTWPLTQL
jgi:hypothetical protein